MPGVIGANTFTGNVTVGGESILRASNNGALGTIAGTNIVQVGGTLELNNGITLADSIGIAGTGVGGRGAIVAMPSNSVTTTTISGNVTLAFGSTIGVDTVNASTPQNTVLNLSGVVSGSGALTKILPGTLRFSGGSANTNTGTITVAEGVLDLAKTTADGAIVAPLVIGNGLGGPNSDRVTVGAGTTEQIGNAIAVTVEATGQLNLGSVTEQVGAVTMMAGLSSMRTLRAEHCKSTTSFRLHRRVQL